jgi:outer membrane protein TolC
MQSWKSAGFVRAVVVVALVLALTVRAANAGDGTYALRFAALTVQQAEDAAVAASPDVQTARAGVAAADAGLAQARGTNGLSVFGSFVDIPQSGGNDTTLQQRIGIVGLQATLDDMLAESPLVVQATAAFAQSETDELVAVRVEKLKVVGLYFAAIRARALTLAKNDAVQSADDFESEVNAKYASGKVPRLDLLRAEIALAKARADQANTIGADKNAADALAREVNRPLADFRDTVNEPVPEFTVAPDDAVIAIALASRPEMASARANVRAAEAGVIAARRAGLPPVTLQGGYAAGVDVGEPVGGPAVTAQMTYPLSGVGAARVRAAQAAVTAADAKQVSVERALAIEVGSAARTASATILARNQTAVALDLARSELNLALIEYRRTNARGLDVATVRDLYEQAIADDITAQYDELQAQATLAVERTP